MIRRKSRNLRTILIIAAIPVIGFSAMYGTAHFLSVSDSAISSAVITLLLIAIGVGVPFWMLKFGFHEARMRNPRDEAELHLSDIPKHKDDMVKDKRYNKA